MGPLLARLGTSVVTWGVVGLLVVSAIAYNKFWSCADSGAGWSSMPLLSSSRGSCAGEPLDNERLRLSPEPVADRESPVPNLQDHLQGIL